MEAIISELSLPDQHTPLHYACQQGRVDVAQRLITNCQCSIESKDEQGCTPLHTAAQYGQVETLKYLLHRLFNHEVSGLIVKLTPGGKLSHTLASKFQQKLSDRHRDQSGNTPLHTACVHGQLDIVQLLTRVIGFDPNITNSEGLSSLHLAVLNGHLPLVRYLVEEVGSDVTLEDEHGRSPTYLAAGEGHLDIIKYLIEEKSADPLFRTSKEWKAPRFTMAPGRSLVHTASREGHLHVVRYLVEHHGCDPSCKDDAGITPLYLVSQQGCMDIVSYLITEAHCDPNCTSEDGRTCLHAASIGGKLNVLKYLQINHNCQINTDPFLLNPLQTVVAGNQDVNQNCNRKKSNIKYSCLHLATQNGHLLLVRYLVDEVGCRMTLDEHGRSPAYLAAAGGHLDILKYLIEEKGADPRFRTSKGWKTARFTVPPGRSLVHIASGKGFLHVVRYLVEYHGCDPSCKDDTGITPLHLACNQGHTDIVSYLITEAQCDPNLTSEDGRTCLHVASYGGRLDVIKYLHINHTCQIKLDSYRWTPLHCAASQGAIDILKYLIEDMNCKLKSETLGEITPLHCACENGHLDVVRYLVDTHHCDPLCPDEDKQTPLHRAAAKGKLEVVNYFARIYITHQSELMKNNFSNTPLHLAALNGHLEVIKIFIENMKCYPYLEGEYWRTPLHHACENGFLDIVKYYTDTLNCPDQRELLVKDKFSYLPLHLAALNGHLEVVKFLVEDMKCNISLVDGKNNTLLHLASLHGHFEIVRYFLENNTLSPNTKGYQKKLLVHFASENGHLIIVKYLVDTQRCDPLCYDEDNNTPLHIAAANGQVEVIHYFTRTLNCSFLMRNIHSNTPLHVAACNGRLEVVKFFIEDLDCDPNFRGQSDMTPLHLSLRETQFEVAMYLINLPKCDIAAIISQNHDHLPTNPLHFAVETQNLDIVSYLCNTRRLDPHLQPDKEKLLEAAKDPTVFEFLKNFTDPLHYAAIYGDLESVKHYVEREKWGPLKLDRFGNNTLHNAALHGQLEVVKFLTGLNKDPIDSSVEILCDPLVKNRYGLTAQDIASQNGHRHVVSYLLRASSNQPVFQQDVISPPFNILIVGNSGSGKSTLVKALTAENSRFGSITKVRGVTPQTAGIVLTTLHSRMYGEVNVYDFAGHEEYYASHEMILQQTAQPLVLVVVNVSLSEEKIQKQILYWLSILSSSSSKDVMKTVHVLIIGSHADQIKFKEKLDIYEQISSLVSKSYFLKYHGNVLCDCRYSASDNLRKLRLKLSTICESIRLFLAHESQDSNSLCAALMSYLKKDGPQNVTITVHELHKSISDSLTPASRLVPFVDQNLLLQSCKKLSSMGHVLFLPHDKNEMDSVLVVDKHTTLSKVHACLQSKKDITNGFGVIEEEHLKCVLSGLLQGIMEPTQAIKYLLFSQFCTEITANQLISVPRDFKGLTHYFFPSLASTLRPDAALLLGDSDYTHLYTWGLKCTGSHQFLTPRYLHSLFIQLTECEGDAINARFIIWKNGILLVHNNGTRSIIEVTDQTTHLYLTMQCVKGCELYLVKQRSKLISLIKFLLSKSCPLVTFDEFLLLPQTTYPLDCSNQIPLADIARSVVGSHPTVLFNYKNIPLRDLLHFDPFHAILEPTLQELFHHSKCTTAAPSSTLRSVCNSIRKRCEEFSQTLSDQASTKHTTYQQLFEQLSHYSIFIDGNFYVSFEF